MSRPGWPSARMGFASGNGEIMMTARSTSSSPAGMGFPRSSRSLTSFREKWAYSNGSLSMIPPSALANQ